MIVIVKSRATAKL